MLGAKAKRVRRKLRALQRSKRQAHTAAAGARALPNKLSDSALAITAACSAAAIGFELCARRTRDPRISVAAEGAARFLHTLFEATITAAAVHGVDARPRARTCDRLRWEWLASTAMVVDGAPAGRLLLECARLLSECVQVVDAVPLGDGIAARLRVASAEAYSLASAVQQMRRGELALALA